MLTPDRSSRPSRSERRYAPASQSIDSVIESIVAAGVSLFLEGGRLRYRCPQGAMTPELRDSLLECREAIVARLAAGGEADGRLVADHWREPTDLSLLRPFWRAMGQRGWAKADVSNATRILRRVSGPLDVALLEAALGVVFGRHDILSGRVYEGDGRLEVQYGLLTAPRLARIDLTYLPESELEMGAAAELSRLVWTPLDPSEALSRAFLITLAADEHLFGLVAHHICADQRSMQIIAAELDAAYADLNSGHPSRRVARPLQFAEYAMAAQAWLGSIGAEPVLTAIQERLARAPPTVLPRDPPTQGNDHGVRLAFTVPPDLQVALEQQQSCTGASIAMILLAAQVAALSAWTGSCDLTVMVVCAGRPSRDLEDAVGPFAADVPHRLRLPDNPTVHDVLARAREASLEVMDQAQVAPVLYRSLMWKARASPIAPWFNYTHSLPPKVENLVTPALGRAISVPPPIVSEVGRGSPYCYAMSIVLHEGRLLGEIVSTEAHYRSATMEAFVQTVLDALRAIASEPSRRVADLAPSRPATD